MLTRTLLSESTNTRLFSLARYAIYEALQVAGIEYGDAVLMPEYVCRDIVAPVRECGANVLFYKVNADLSPLEHPNKWPKAKVVIAVNYFGFPQDINPFNRYSKKRGATIIEDNAHGFLSKDLSGTWLGLRAEIGIFSIRKTFCIPDGAAIVVNNDVLKTPLAKQLPFSGKGFSKTIEIKCAIKQLSFVGVYLWRLLIWLMRSMRKLITGQAIPAPVDMDQYVTPYQPNPHKNILSNLLYIAHKEDSEIHRRRSLYRQIYKMIDLEVITPLFTDLQEGVSPLGFPFRSLEHDAILLGNSVKYLGVDLMKWPDLPNNISNQEHYHNVWVINFL